MTLLVNAASKESQKQEHLHDCSCLRYASSFQACVNVMCFVFYVHIKPAATAVCLQQGARFEPSVAKCSTIQLHQEVGVACRLVTALAAQLGLKFLFANIVEVKQLGSTWSVWHRHGKRRRRSTFVITQFDLYKSVAIAT